MSLENRSISHPKGDVGLGLTAFNFLNVRNKLIRKVKLRLSYTIWKDCDVTVNGSLYAFILN